MILECSHNIRNYNQISWYQQTHDRGIVFMGYLVRQGYPETEFIDKISIKGSPNRLENNKMTMLNLVPNDTALYFCAASIYRYTVKKTHTFLYKKP